MVLAFLLRCLPKRGWRGERLSHTLLPLTFRSKRNCGYPSPVRMSAVTLGLSTVAGNGGNSTRAEVAQAKKSSGTGSFLASAEAKAASGWNRPLGKGATFYFTLPGQEEQPLFYLVSRVILLRMQTRIVTPNLHNPLKTQEKHTDGTPGAPL